MKIGPQRMRKVEQSSEFNHTINMFSHIATLCYTVVKNFGDRCYTHLPLPLFIPLRKIQEDISVGVRANQNIQLHALLN